MQIRWAKLGIIMGGWAIVGSILSLEILFNMRASMKAEYFDVLGIAIPQFGRALMWALLAPLVLKLRKMVPLSQGNWLGGMSFHLAVSFLVMAEFYVGRVFFMLILWDEWPLGEFWNTVLANFYGRNIIDMAYYWGVIAYGYSFEIYHKYKNEEIKAAQLEARLIESELNALRQQLHPHFLFNTMNTVAVLVREGQNEQAVSLLSRLSALLRISLDQTRSPEVTLQQEVDFLERYLEIQQARFSDRLSVTVDIPIELRTARIPNLMLQPIVENAILHGVAPKSGPGHVHVSGRKEGDDLCLEVRDDGPGVVNTGRGRVREGIGLANTRERLAKLYGPAGRLTLTSVASRGVTVLIALPYHV
jgi:two-component system, LytTR family, sensor kinase|uniref:sensor histidine kinase n=1 Tax=Cephaloticoccus sp. TaxID=1985742 RepID=UPI0040499A2F